jgi:hypothetical protein
MRFNTEMFEAYTNMIDPSPEVKRKINSIHRDNPYGTPFGEDRTPYPEVSKRTIDPYEMLDPANTDEPLQFSPPSNYEGGWASIRDVVEGDVLYEDEDGDEHWMAADVAAAALPWTDIESPDEVEVAS